MNFRDLFKLLLIAIIFSGGCIRYDSDETLQSGLPGAEYQNQVLLIAQTVEAVSISEDLGEAVRLALSRKFSYSVEWAVNSYDDRSGLLTLNNVTNETEDAIAKIQADYTSSGGTYTIRLTRQNEIVSMADVSLEIDIQDSPLEISLIASDSDRLIYEFFSEISKPGELKHRLSFNNLDLFDANLLRLRYESNSGNRSEFSEPAKVILIRNDTFHLELLNGIPETTQTLEEHLTDFFNILFADLNSSCIFSLKAEGVYYLAPSNVVVKMPIALYPSISTANLNAYIATLGSDIRTFIKSTNAEFRKLRFYIEVQNFDGTSLFKLTDVSLEINCVSNIN